MTVLYGNQSAWLRWSASREARWRFHSRHDTHRSRALCLRRILAAGEYSIMATTRDEIAESLHRLANYTETQLCNLLCDLVRDGRTIAVTDLAWQGSRFVQCCREIRDGKEGGEE